MVPYRVFVAGLPCDIAVYSTLNLTAWLWVNIGLNT
jgi:hypothetical protein